MIKTEQILNFSPIERHILLKCLSFIEKYPVNFVDGVRLIEKICDGSPNKTLHKKIDHIILDTDFVVPTYAIAEYSKKMQDDIYEEIQWYFDCHYQDLKRIIADELTTMP